MKVQLQGQKMRLRVTRDEFDAILGGQVIRDETEWPDGRLDRVELLAGDQSVWVRLADGWQVRLQAQALRDLEARWPDRDGFSFEQPTPGRGPFVISFDIDLKKPRKA